MLKIKALGPKDFWALVEKHEKKVFTGQTYAAHQHMLAREKENFEERKKFIQERIALYYVLLDEKNNLAGWTAGFQMRPNDFFMMTSAVLPKYRGKDGYTKLLKEVLEKTKALGFQVVYSKHLATNNPIIIAKLKLGFMVAGMEVSDQMGTVVRMVYSHNPLREELLRYRTGELHPSLRVKKALKLK